MVTVSFTENLARHVSLETIDVAKGTLADVFDLLFEVYPKLKPYILDEQGELRQHIMLALDKQLIQGNLRDYINESGFSRLHIMQALSGG